MFRVEGVEISLNVFKSIFPWVIQFLELCKSSSLLLKSLDMETDASFVFTLNGLD